jgi:hypothetical protein
MCSPVADLGVGDEALGPELAAEQGAAELVEQDLVLGHVARGHRAVEDDPGSAAVDQVVVLVPEDAAPVPHGHGRRVRVGATDLAVREAAVRPRGRAGGIQAALLQEVPPPRAVLRRPLRAVRGGGVAEEGDQMAIHDVAEPGHEGIRGGVAGDPGGVGEDLLPPDEARLLAQVDHALEEAAEDGEPEALADPGEAGGVRQRLVEAVAEGPSGR